ncbi:hypothetical protein PLICRDRAFT_128261 [Plicaturopsis crispa FD-325 SS-3]|nr:hypothetical protein PLICRDRAFT_128261 [Plicaturopsis crispa FD-325 SS-3]
MGLLHYLSYAAVVAAFAFITLSLASGLLYVSELIEEHSRTSKVVGQRGIYVIIVLHALLYAFDTLPLWQTAFSIGCHIVYLQNFSATWPLISLSSWSFIASCLLVVSDHFAWFFHFSRVTQDARNASHARTYQHHPTPAAPTFAEIATFFGLCVWLAPLFLFLSLSANDNALPTSSANPSDPMTPAASPRMLNRYPVPSRSSLFKSLFEHLPRVSPKLRRRDTTEGIIAPHSPITSRPSSPSPMAIPGSPTQYQHSISRATSIPRGLDADMRQSSNFQLGTPPRRIPENMRRATAEGTGLGLGMRRSSSRSVVGES